MLALVVAVKNIKNVAENSVMSSQFGVSTASFFGKFDTEIAIDQIHKLGIKNCEVFFSTFCEYEMDFMDVVKNKLNKFGLEAKSIHALSTQFEPQLFSSNERQKKDALITFEKLLAGGKHIGAKTYVLHGPTLVKRTSDSFFGLERKAKILQELCEIASTYDIKIGFENVHWCLFNHPLVAKKLIEYGAYDVCFTLDIKQAMQSKIDVYEYLDVIADKLINVHICDYKIVDGKTVLCIPGEGVFDFAKLKNRLCKINYNGPVIYEVYANTFENFDQLEKSVDFCKNLFS